MSKGEGTAVFCQDRGASKRSMFGKQYGFGPSGLFIIYVGLSELFHTRGAVSLYIATAVKAIFSIHLVLNTVKFDPTYLEELQMTTKVNLVRPHAWPCESHNSV